MEAESIVVRQWSFCIHCKGRGCFQCAGSGVTSELVPLESLFGKTKVEYAKSQEDFIRTQKSKYSEGGK